jgi:hypothetical protein
MVRWHRIAAINRMQSVAQDGIRPQQARQTWWKYIDRESTCVSTDHLSVARWCISSASFHRFWLDRLVSAL